jgi:nucleotide-binding universal stress UspA family protein
MQLPTNILVPTDFSAGSADALRYGVQLAKKLDARLYVLHVWFTPVAGWEGAWAIPREAIAELENGARSELEAFVAEARQQLPGLETICVEGDPRDTILRHVAALKADLIVIGTHGRTGISRVLSGSVTEDVIRRAACPVLAVRQTQPQ